MSRAPSTSRRWKRVADERLVDLGVFRDVADPSAPYGRRYRSVETLTAPAVSAPVALPSSRIAVADLLP